MASAGFQVQLQLAAQQAGFHSAYTPFRAELRPRSLEPRTRKSSLRASTSKEVPPPSSASMHSQPLASSFSPRIRPDTSSRETRAAAAPEVEGPAAATAAPSVSSEYQPTPLDEVFLMMFRRKLVKETGWKSTKAGYDGMIEEAKRLLNMYPNRRKAEEAAVRILLGFFPPGLLPLFKRFLAPALNGRLGPYLSAKVTLVTCQWLMGPSKASQVQLADGSVLDSGVKIDKCRFLEETKCAGSCMHTCKIPTQAFMQEHMGVPLHMEPNLEDFSCEFKFGVPAPSREDDEILRKPCLSVCPVATSRRLDAPTCPEVSV